MKIISITPTLETNNDNVERLWATISRLYRPYVKTIKENKHLGIKAFIAGQDIITFEIFADENEIKYNFVVPNKLRRFMESQIRAAWPDCFISEAEDYIDFDINRCAFANINLKEHFAFPLKYDPKNINIKQILYPFTTLEKGEKALLQILVRPIDEDKFKKKYQQSVEQINEGKNPLNINGFIMHTINILEFILKTVTMFSDKLTGYNEKSPNNIGKNNLFKTNKIKLDKSTKKNLNATIRIAIQSNNQKLAELKLFEFVEALNSVAEYNEFVFNQPMFTKKFYEKLKQRTLSLINIYNNIISNSELAQFIGFPEVDEVSIDKLKRICIKPTTVPSSMYEGVFEFGYHVIPNENPRMLYWDINNIDTLVRPRVYISDPGGGKSIIAENTCIDLAKLGYGFCFIDVADGIAADRILERIPKKREKDIIMIDMTDLKWPPAIDFSEFKHTDRFNSAQATKMWTDFFMSYFKIETHYMSKNLLRKACAVVFDEPGNSLLEVKMMIEDEEYRIMQMDRIKNKPNMLRFYKFWERFNEMPFKVKQEAIKPILNKIDTIIDDERIRNILCQKNSKLPTFRELMDKRKLIIIKIGSTFGYENISIIASLIIMKFWIAALTRENIPVESRVPFFLLMDEPQTYLGTTNVAQEMLAKARKYRLCPIMFFQTPKQLNIKDKKLLGTLFDLKPHIIFGKQSEQTYKYFSEEIKPLTPTDGANLPKHHFIAKIYKDQTPLQPFIFKSLWRPDIPTYDRENIIRDCKIKYCRYVNLVEDDINQREIFHEYSNVKSLDNYKFKKHLGKAAQLE